MGVAVALASEGVAEAEREVLTAIASAAGISPHRLDRLTEEEQAAVGGPSGRQG